MEHTRAELANTLTCWVGALEEGAHVEEHDCTKGGPLHAYAELGPVLCQVHVGNLYLKIMGKEFVLNKNSSKDEFMVVACLIFEAGKMESVPQDMATQDQVAAVMLRHGSKEQVAEALAYSAGLLSSSQYGSTILDEVFVEFSQKHHGILNSGDLQSVAKYIEMLKERLSHPKVRGMVFVVETTKGGMVCVETTSAVHAAVVAERHGHLVRSVKPATDAQISHFAFLS
jgi:hypothetical protein